MKKIAVVGTGISGMAASYLLSRSHEVHVFEAGSHIGGHTHTHHIEHEGQSFSIDTGFIVYNEKTYPLLMSLFAKLGVETQETEMSFSVRCDEEDLEYNGHTLWTLFAQKRNFFRPSFYRLLKEIVRFNNLVKEVSESITEEETLETFLNTHGFHECLKNWYLYPMVGAIWSAGTAKVGAFPMKTFAHFFENHGLLNINDRPVWRVVQGGSKSYVPKITKPYAERVRLNCPVRSVTRHDDKVTVATKQGEEDFDEIVIACHSDQALRLLSDPSPQEKEVLGGIHYKSNEVVLHTDIALLPKRRAAWASWNYNLSSKHDHQATVTYNMNILQGLQHAHQFCVTLNNTKAIDSSKILKTLSYDHPVYNNETISSQKRFDEISGIRNTHYCGAYWFNGFHEDGMRSAVRVASHFGEGEI